MAKNIILGIILVVLLGIGGLSLLKKRVKDISHEKIILSKKEQIIDEAQFIFNPIIEIDASQKKLKVLLEVTSYLSPDLLNIDFKEQTVLEVNAELIPPNEWRLLEKSKYKLIGQYTFDISSVDQITPFSIKLFSFSDHEIYWD
jgi:hypothetical protein